MGDKYEGDAPMGKEEPRPLRQFISRDEDASVLELGPEFSPEKAQALFLSEASYLLQKKVEQHQTATLQGDINPVLKKAFEYAERFDTFRSADTAMTVRAQLSKIIPPLHPFEIAQLATLVPSTADEAKVIIPSLADKFDDDKLQDILQGLNRLKQ